MITLTNPAVFVRPLHRQGKLARKIGGTFNKKKLFQVWKGWKVLLRMETMISHRKLPYKQVNYVRIQGCYDTKLTSDDKPVYENALCKSGCISSLKYSEEIHQHSSKKRTRKIIWFNPPFTQTVKTNVAKLFFRLLDKHFPKSHLLHKIFNRNTIKVSYSCMNNVSQIIKQHNRNVSNKKEKQTNPCNCRNKNECPLNGNCKVQNVIYKCTVSATQTFKQRVYLGIAEGNQKQRLYNYRQSFKDKKHKNDAVLSSYLLDLKENHNQIQLLGLHLVIQTLQEGVFYALIRNY